MTREERDEAILFLRENRKVQIECKAMPASIIALDRAIEALKAQPCEDAVSREAALKEMERYHDDCSQTSEYTRLGFETAMEVVKSLPSVTPKQKVVRCKDCKHRDPETKKCDCGCWHFPFVTEDDDFCSYGETKMEGESE